MTGGTDSPSAWAKPTRRKQRTTGATPRHAPVVWLAALAYVLCAVARLAFYTPTSPAQTGFIGVPAPAAALAWATTMVLTRRGEPLALSLATAATAMILPIHLSRPSGRGLAFFALWAASVIAVAFR